MQNLSNLSNLGALGVRGGSALFDPSSIKDSEGNLLLSQQLFTKHLADINGTIYDESKNKGDARAVQLGRAYTGDGVDDRLQLPFDLVASDVITKEGAGTLTPDYANNRIAISGQVWNIEIKDNTDVVKAFYKCDEVSTSSTDCIDSSGSGNDAIIQNATLSTFRSTQNVYSWHNEVGYTLGTGSNGYASGVFIPRDESNPLFDVAGNPLQFTGRVPYNARLLQSNCLRLDGVDDQVVHTTTGTQFNPAPDVPFETEILFNPDTIHQGYLWAKTSGSTGFGVLFRDGTIRLVTSNGGGITHTTGGNPDSTNSFTASTWQWLKVVSDGTGNITFFRKLAGATSYTQLNTLTGCTWTQATNQNLIIGNRPGGSAYYDGDIAHISISIDDVIRYENNFVEGNGTDTYDISIPSYVGTLQNGATYAKQNVRHTSIVRGFSLYEHASLNPIQVPYNINGEPMSITPPTGYTLTRHCPAGAWHNSAATQIDFRNGVNSPEAVINSWETAWAFNTARTNPGFKRTLTSSSVDARADRFLAYKETLSGTNLSKVNKYVETKAI